VAVVGLGLAVVSAHGGLQPFRNVGVPAAAAGLHVEKLGALAVTWHQEAAEVVPGHDR
jgi:hypothetical protein